MNEGICGRFGRIGVVIAAYRPCREAVERLARKVDEAVILETPRFFQAVGQFYHEFDPVSDEEVVSLLT